MNNQNILFALLILTIFSLTQFTSSEPDQLHFTGGFCSKSDNVPANGTYANNTISLLVNLTLQSSDSRFFNTSVGTGVDKVNGLYLCRPDISLETCRKCVMTSSKLFLDQCTNKKEAAILWYEECMLRYSNRTIFATVEDTQYTYFATYFNVSQPDEFPALLNQTIQKIIAEAALPTNTLRFATGSANYTAFEGLYGMALCTPDITPLECWNCLRTAFDKIPGCCGGLSESTIVALPSCQLRYDTAPFIFPWPASSSSVAPAPSG